jgi:soluble lytic murein transglycosylase-like protein
MKRLLLAGVVCVLAVPTTVQAQIYAWRDADGNLVLSDRAKVKEAEKIDTFSPKVESAAIATLPPVTAKRAALYDDLIVAHARDQNIRADLVHAVIRAESAYDPWARSFKGAMGLMQLMPQTARDYGVLNPYDPAENIRAGVRYLRRLLDRYDDNEELALAAYNAGPTTVDRYGQKVPPYRETQTYVAKITKASAKSPSRRVYRTVEIVDGREVVRYSNKPAAKPASKSAAR